MPCGVLPKAVPLGHSSGDPETSDTFRFNNYIGSYHYMAETELFRIDHEITASLDSMDDDELRSFAKLQEDPASNEQTELYIYTCFFIFKRTCSTEQLEQAVLRTEGWIAEVAADHPDRARRFHILDVLVAQMSQHRLILEDVVPPLPQIR
jgi:hypothetical protein